MPEPDLRGMMSQAQINLLPMRQLVAREVLLWRSSKCECLVGTQKRC
jgi:hypothetical protein